MNKNAILSLSSELCIHRREYLDHAEEGGEGLLLGADLDGRAGLGLAKLVAACLVVRDIGV